MRVELCSGSQLPGSLLARWNELLSANPELASPYFRPEFTQAVAALRNNVEVGVLHDGNTIVGFFPFERVRGYIARPVGGRLSDYQGIIAHQGTPWSVSEVMRGCRLRTWEFDHQLVTQTQLAPHFITTAKSWFVDLAPGYDNYLAARRAAGTEGLRETLRRSRKLQRDYQVRFEWHCRDEVVFDQMLAWKSEQYRRNGLTDLFTYDWIRSLLKNIWRSQSQQFAGVLGAMYANDQVAAVHFGMRSGSLFHSWFPAYNVELRKYSPGLALLLLQLQSSAEQGVTCLDLGKGDEEYKLMFATGGVPLAEGVAGTRLVSATVNRGLRHVRQWVKQSPLRDHARVPIRWLRRMRDWLTMR